MRICIVSGTTQPKYHSEVNHAIYARLNSYDYVFDTTSYASVQNVFFHKTHAIRNALPHYDWVFWLDDDAFFTKFDKRLEFFIDGVDTQVFMLICQGLVLSRRGQFTYFNAGVLFLRNCNESLAFLDSVNNVRLETVKAWWNPRRFGIYTAGDQDAITYILHHQELMPKVCVLPYNAFNTRPQHFGRSATEHFLVHFRVDDKPSAMRAFASKFDLDEEVLVPRQLLPAHP